MPLRPVVSIPADIEDGAVDAAAATTSYYPQVATPVSRTSSCSRHNGNGGGPLRSSSECSSLHRCRSTGERSLVTSAAAAGTTSPFYRHNPYLASPASETQLHLATPDSFGLEDAAGRLRSSSSNSLHRTATDHSVDVTADWRRVVRSRSRQGGVSSLTHSTSENGTKGVGHHHQHPHHPQQHRRIRHMSSAFMNPLEGEPTPATDAAHLYHARCDSTASLPGGDNPSYSAMLYTYTDSSSASHHASPSLEQITPLTHALTSPLVPAPSTQQRTESPATSRHSTVNKSYSYGSPETPSLYYSFGNHSAATGISTSNNPYVGVRITPETPTALAVNQDGLSPLSSALQQQLAVPRVNNKTITSTAASAHGCGEASGAYNAHRRTHTAEGITLRMVRVYPSISSHTTTPQNSPGGVVLNANESIGSTPSTYLEPTGAAAAQVQTAAAAAAAAMSLTATPRSHCCGTPPPYNQPSSAPLSPDTASMIVPPSHPASVSLHEQHQRSASAGAGTALPPYVMTTDASRSEVSNSSYASSGYYPYHYAQLQRQRQTAQSFSAARTPSPFMPPSRATCTVAVNSSSLPTYAHSNSNGAIQFLHSPGSDASQGTTTANIVTAMATPPPQETAMGIPPPPYDTRPAVATPYPAEVLSDRSSTATPYRTAGTEEGEEEHTMRNSGGGAAALATSKSEENVAVAPPTTMAGPPETSTAAEVGVEVEGHGSGCPQHPHSDASEQQQRLLLLQRECEKEQEAFEESKAQRKTASKTDPETMSDDDSEDEDAEGGTTQTTSATAGGAKAKNKKKRARRNRKLKFLEDLPPATEMKFLPPPPPPLPLPYEGTPEAGINREATVDFCKYYGVLLRWYERILADESDFVGTNYTLFSSSALPAAQASVTSGTSLEASHTTLQTSGILQTSGPTQDAAQGSTVFALTNFTSTPAAEATSVNVSPVARTRRMPGGGEVPVLCPRIEKYLPLSEIPARLRGSSGGGGGVEGRPVADTNSSGLKLSLQSAGSNEESNETTAEGMKKDVGGAAMDKAAVLHVQSIDKVVQWAKDLNSWWFNCVHPHSFNSRRQHIPQGYRIATPASAVAAAAMASVTAPYPPSTHGSNMEPMYGWSPSMVMTGYEGQMPYQGPTGMGSGGVGMSVLNADGSLTTAATPEHTYSGLSMVSYSPYSIPVMAPPLPPALQQMQPMPQSSITGIYAMYPH